MEVIEIDEKLGKVSAVFSLDVGDQLFWRDAFFLGAQHDCRAVGVVCADVSALIAAMLLEAHPHIGLDVLEHVAEVNRAVGIGQGAGDEDLAWLGHGARLLDETVVGHYKAPGNIFHPVLAYLIVCAVFVRFKSLLPVVYYRYDSGLFYSVFTGVAHERS